MGLRCCRGSGRGDGAAAVFGLLVAGVEGDLPGAVGLLLPEGDVAAGGEGGFAEGVGGAGFVVAPGVAGVAGGQHGAALGGPLELVVLGVPFRHVGDGGATDEGGLLVLNFNAVFCEPGGEGAAAAGEGGGGEFLFEVEEEERAGRQRGLGEWRSGGLGGREWVKGALGGECGGAQNDKIKNLE